MKYTRENILDVLITVLQEIQQNVVDEPEPIGEDTVPIGNLCDFDSLVSVEATVNALNVLGIKEESLPSPSIFISKDNKALTLGQVADLIVELKIK